MPEKRLASLDVLRGLTILVMIFVNDLAGVGDAPAWMKHFSPHDGDGMTFVDVVFPAFLFIVGMSIPLAIGRRLERGDSPWTVWRHILVRTLGLLVIGVFMVNAETMPEHGRLPAPLWELLAYIAVFMVWSAAPRTFERPARTRALRAAGIGLLLLLAVLYRGQGPAGFIEMRPQWWGILGLIGWAYLVACAVYLLARSRMAALVGAIALLYCVFIADAAGAFAGWTWITRWLQIGSMLGSHAAITVSGVVLGVVLTPSSEVQAHRDRLRWALVYALGLAAAAHLLHAAHGVHRMFIINKILATPPWCLWSSAITVAVWIPLYWWIEVRGRGSWARLLEPAGQNPLAAYLLAPMIYDVLALLALVTGLPDLHEVLGSPLALGLFRSVLVAVLVAWLAGRLRRLGLQLAL
jgi:heparan-alpha-glucosaminide N-acetyltransferase